MEIHVDAKKIPAIKMDFLYLSIILLTALIIGVYLICTTVLISKDGVYYIEQAQEFEKNSGILLKHHPPGYPLLILTAYKFLSLFTNNSSNQVWIYSAQSVSLLFRLLTIIPLYFIGKLLVGNNKSFWGILILILLPYPAALGSDVLREWPYLFILFTGLFFLLWSLESRKWWLMGIAGFISAIGYLIRPESFQIVIYGIIWLLLCIVNPKIWNVKRYKSAITMLLLVGFFILPTVCYMAKSKKILPSKVKAIIKKAHTSHFSDDIETIKVSKTSGTKIHPDNYKPRKIHEALIKIFNSVGENTMWFFLLMMLLGLLHYIRHNIRFEQAFLIICFIIMNITMMVLRYYVSIPHISKRWTLALVALLALFVPTGVESAGQFLNKFSKSKITTETITQKKRISWPVIITLTGLLICLPKLVRPLGYDKQSYLEAVNWLKNNSSIDDNIVSSDKRIPFYAQRNAFKLKDKLPEDANYLIYITEANDDLPKLHRDMIEKHSVWKDKEKKGKIIIYEIL